MHGHLNVSLSRCTVTWTPVYHDARSPERQFITMHGNLNVNLSRCTVTWTSVYHDARSTERQFITMHGHLNVSLSQFTVTWTSNCVSCRFHWSGRNVEACVNLGARGCAEILLVFIQSLQANTGAFLLNRPRPITSTSFQTPVPATWHHTKPSHMPLEASRFSPHVQIPTSVTAEFQL